MSIIISFGSLKLKKICEDKNIALQELSDCNIVESLYITLSDMRAVESLFDLLLQELIQIKGLPPGVAAIELDNNVYLYFCSAHQDTPCLDNGYVNWARVVRIKILKIGNSYE